MDYHRDSEPSSGTLAEKRRLCDESSVIYLSLIHILTQSLRGPIVLWSIILGLHLATQNSRILPRYLHHLPAILSALGVLAVTIAASRLAGNAVRFYGAHLKGCLLYTSRCV